MAQSQPKMMDHLQQPFADGSTNIILSLHTNKNTHIIYNILYKYKYIYICTYTHKNTKKKLFLADDPD